MIAIKLYKPGNEQGIPSVWPSEIREVVDALPEGFDLLVADNDEYEAYRAQHQPDYDKWEAAQAVNVAVPESIPRFKLRLWLNAAGLLEHVEAMIADPKNWPDAKAHRDAQILWNERPDVRRDSVMVNNLGASLGLSPEQIDAAFIEANQID